MIVGVSPLVSMKRVSPNRTSPRNHKIDTITIHCYVGQASIEDMASWLCNPSAKASANYGIGSDGRIISFMDDNDRSWCSSSSSNDNRAITIECASDKTGPYAINNKVYKSLINLCVDICKRHGIKELKWKADKSLIGHPDKQNMTVHRWFANKACPGDYIYNRLGKIAEEVNVKLGINKKPDKGLQACSLKNLSEKEVIEKVGSLFTADQKKNGILASVSLAQFILESGYGKTDLAQNANNCFGMKCKLSGNTWTGSTWDGKSKYTKITKECYDGVNYVDVKADFRKYPSISKSIGDHSAYLLGAMNGSKKRYAGLKGCKDYRKAITIIKNGGYATDPKYIDKICNIIERWDLTKYDVKSNSDSNSSSQDEDILYRVRKTWTNVSSQKGAFHEFDNAKKCANEHPGYSVYDEKGKILYTSKKPNSTVPFKIRVDITDLNIRTGPGTNYAKTGHYTGAGVFTIVDVKSGKGSDKGWGKLKSGAGWISLDFSTKL